MRMLAWRIPNARLHAIDDGHLFLITRAEAVAPIIMKFLEEERVRAGVPCDQRCRFHTAAQLAENRLWF